MTPFGGRSGRPPTERFPLWWLNPPSSFPSQWYNDDGQSSGRLRYLTNTIIPPAFVTRCSAKFFKYLSTQQEMQQHSFRLYLWLISNLSVWFISNLFVWFISNRFVVLSSLGTCESSSSRARSELDSPLSGSISCDSSTCRILSLSLVFLLLVDFFRFKMTIQAIRARMMSGTTPAVTLIPAMAPLLNLFFRELLLSVLFLTETKLVAVDVGRLFVEEEVKLSRLVVGLEVPDRTFQPIIGTCRNNDIFRNHSINALSRPCSPPGTRPCSICVGKSGPHFDQWHTAAGKACERIE